MVYLRYIVDNNKNETWKENGYIKAISLANNFNEERYFYYVII